MAHRFPSRRLMIGGSLSCLSKIHNARWDIKGARKMQATVPHMSVGAHSVTLLIRAWAPNLHALADPKTGCSRTEDRRG